MGKNSYLGGGTILHGGSSFFSRDRNSKRSRVISAEKEFLLKCVRAELAGRKYPLSYSEHEKLRAVIAKAGSVTGWLKEHPDYEKIKNREIKKQEKRTVEKQKKKARKIAVQKKQTESKAKREKRELNYLKDFIWAQIIGRPVPQNKPKGFSKKCPTEKDLLNWATGHDKFAEVYQELAAKREKQLAKLNEIQNHTVKVVKKKDIHKRD